MTPTQQWILDLALVYSVPSFFCGMGVTLLWTRWRGLRQAAALVRDNLDIYKSHSDQPALREHAMPDSHAALRDRRIKSLAG